MRLDFIYSEVNLQTHQWVTSVLYISKINILFCTWNINFILPLKKLKILLHNVGSNSGCVFPRLHVKFWDRKEVAQYRTTSGRLKTVLDSNDSNSGFVSHLQMKFWAWKVVARYRSTPGKLKALLHNVANNSGCVFPRLHMKFWAWKEVAHYRTTPEKMVCYTATVATLCFSTSIQEVRRAKEARDYRATAGSLQVHYTSLEVALYFLLLICTWNCLSAECIRFIHCHTWRH